MGTLGVSLLITAVLNFDGLHYFQNEYRFEQNHAFLPFFVAAITALKKLIGDQAALILFVILNRCLFILSAWEIKSILLILFREKD